MNAAFPTCTVPAPRAVGCSSAHRFQDCVVVSPRLPPHACGPDPPTDLAYATPEPRQIRGFGAVRSSDCAGVSPRLPPHACGSDPPTDLEYATLEPHQSYLRGSG